MRLVSFFLIAVTALPLCAQTDAAIRTFLLKQYDDVPEVKEDFRVRIARVDLNGDGKDEFVVYVIGSNLCGSGGCNLFVLETQGDTFQIVSDVSISRPPIRVLDSSHNGWRDLSVYVAGGGILQGYEAELRFDGTSYPRNPSVPPAIPRNGEVSGRVLIPREQ